MQCGLDQGEQKSGNWREVPSTGAVDAISIRARLLDGLATIQAFGNAVGRCQRTVYAWIEQGMPTVYIGRTPYIPVDEAKKWLIKPCTRNAPARKPGRPRKSAYAANLRSPTKLAA